MFFPGWCTSERANEKTSGRGPGERLSESRAVPVAGVLPDLERKERWAWVFGYPGWVAANASESVSAALHGPHQHIRVNAMLPTACLCSRVLSSAPIPSVVASPFLFPAPAE